MATLLPFPPRLRFSAMHWFDAETGRGAIVAVFFQVPLDHTQHGHADKAADQQQGGQVEAGTQP